VVSVVEAIITQIANHTGGRVVFGMVDVDGELLGTAINMGVDCRHVQLSP